MTSMCTIGEKNALRMYFAPMIRATETGKHNERKSREPMYCIIFKVSMCI